MTWADGKSRSVLIIISKKIFSSRSKIDCYAHRFIIWYLAQGYSISQFWTYYVLSLRF